ncbi:hypothetical protein PRK78_005031 [Emydomyces testavorans]|uniref:RTA1 domain protein n=1 Tax=Emydomyces testavorans TaxID=2070801 RepID=A0AAF0DKZ7_9EURO|nr:hypothetical protein PRK78_005031 [Emydomyces testavorans]
MFTVGFALREYGAFHYLFSNENLNVYIASTSFIYMSPPLLELANYHVLGRILYYVPYFSPLHPGRVLTTFGALSAIVEVLNAIGVSYIANQALPESLTKLGQILMKLSLVTQIVIIALFCLLGGTFHWRCARASIRIHRVSAPLLTLYISTSIILVRCIYRTIEHFNVLSVRHGPGVDLTTLSPIVRYEWFFYVFEASLMLVNSFLWNWRHPRQYLPENYNIYLAQDGVTELEGPGWKDDRPLIMTMFDPFSWCEPKTQKQRPFWETNGYTLVTAGSNGAKDRHYAEAEAV